MVACDSASLIGELFYCTKGSKNHFKSLSARGSGGTDQSRARSVQVLELDVEGRKATVRSCSPEFLTGTDLEPLVRALFAIHES